MKSLEDLKRLRDEALKNMTMRYIDGGIRIQVGMGTCGIASGAKPILSAFLENVEKYGLPQVAVLQVGCMGECAYEPMAELIDENGQSFVYCSLTTSMVEEIVVSHIMQKAPIKKYLLSTRKG
jgi:NADP-reducing hydrogenase subunit HndB